MTRQNIVYVISDNWAPRRKHELKDESLRTLRAALELYFKPPLGKYQIVYVNTFEDILTNLFRRFSQNEDKVGNLIIALHGTEHGVKLPIFGKIQGFLNHKELQMHLAGLLDILNDRADTKRRFEDLRGRRIDSQTTLAFFGCNFGKNQQLMDDLREFLGGNLTVFAPKLKMRVNTPRAGWLTNLSFDNDGPFGLGAGGFAA